MFREMRRSGNLISKDEAVKILEKATNGVLAVHGDDGYPYAVPLSYVYSEGRILFHGATEGHKLDAIKNEAKVSFCVIGQDNIIPEDFNTLFTSVILFGKAKVLTEEKEKRTAMEAILQKYSGEFMDSGKQYLKEQWDNCTAVEISIEHISGKAGD